MDGSSAIPADLTGVPETLLWTLYYRTQEAARPDAVLRDPLAVELVSRIDYPFADRLGTGPSRAQWQGLRSRTFDDRVRAFLERHPGGTVVALGEGLETEFWRIDNGSMRWIGVDLPEAAALRAAVLPGHDRRRQIDADVLDPGWTDAVDPSQGVLFTAQGLLMYLRGDQVHELVTMLASRFPGGELVFDGVPRWTSAMTTRRPVPVGGDMSAPPMPWPMDGREARVLRALPGVRAVVRLHLSRGRGPLHGLVLPALERTPILDDLILSIWSVRFGPRPR